MTVEEFERTVRASAPPQELPLVLAALWWDAKGDWEKAHECAQQQETADHAWVHSYLHRKQGDTDNALYWYGRAGRPAFEGRLDDEWREITEAPLDK